jgi:hypothetical protein
MSKQETINEVIEFLRSEGKSYTADFLRDHYRDKPLPFKVGDVCYFNDRADGVWSTDILKTINKKDCLPFVTSYAFWKYIALENPLLNPDTRIYTKEDL